MTAGPATPDTATPPCFRRTRCGAFAFLIAAVGAASAPAQEGQFKPEEKTAIAKAIGDGIGFLRASQNPDGTWGEGKEINDGKHVIGYTALAGLTLAECGIAPTDGKLRQAAAVVRAGVPKIDSTYEVALAILFLDRMGDPKDRKTIQALAARLIAGQTVTGGWGYKVPILSGPETTTLLTALRKLSPATGLNTAPPPPDDPDAKAPPEPETKLPADSGRARKQIMATLTRTMQNYQVFQDPDEVTMIEQEGKTSCNSNTHFAMLGLWASRRHGVPTDRTYALVFRRFRSSQASDGGWTYEYPKTGKPAGGTPAMTSIGLLGEAIGHALKLDARVGPPEKDQQIINGLRKLGSVVGEPAGKFEGRPTVEAAGGLYFLWAMERIAVLYDQKTIGNKDWYRWGAEILVCHQKVDGSWEKGGYPGENPVLNTCMALMVLRRANLTPDLAKRLTVDASALTTSVAPPPPPKAEPPPTVSEPPPPPKEEPPPPKPAPKVEPVKAEAPAPAPAPQPTPADPPKKEEPKQSILPLILALVAVLGGGGLLAFFLIRRKQAQEGEGDEEEDEEEGAKAKKPKGTDKAKGKPKKPRAKT